MIQHLREFCKMLIGFLVITLIIVIVGSLYVIRQNLRLHDESEVLLEQVEESLDILDNIYRRIFILSELPMASDEPEFRQLALDLQQAKTSILLIANKISYVHSPPEELDDRNT